MEDRKAKLALARKKLKDHQEKKQTFVQKEDVNYKSESCKVADAASVPNLNNEVVPQYLSNTLQNLQPFISNINADEHMVMKHDPQEKDGETDVNITEILISNKRSLELQINELQRKLNQLEQNHESVANDKNLYKKKNNELEKELLSLNEKHLSVNKDFLMKDKIINELNSSKLSLTEENTNLKEQLEFTKTVLNAKEAESDSLHNQLFNLQNQYDVIYLQLQQLTNGSLINNANEKVAITDKTESLIQKISSLEQQLSLKQKERDQISLHYEHYVAELNNELKSVIEKNAELTRVVENLSNRENNLIEQISDMEIRIQNFSIHKQDLEIDQNSMKIIELTQKLNNIQDEFNKLQNNHDELQSRYAESISKIKQLSEVKGTECDHDNLSLSKLSADMTSDKVAAQRAMEQNKKLKQDMQGLEEAFVKMSKDKLELTEKISAEKYLNRELTIKLSEIDERAKDMQIKLKAKDEEMIRLQSKYREIEKQCEDLMIAEKNRKSSDIVLKHNDVQLENHLDPDSSKLQTDEEGDKKMCHTLSLQQDDAMTKLQDRFLKIMGEVADLSDEKHRLEHIILQLQNETDTICEYVALYQQQRSLLKRRDEERSAHLKVFQQECQKLKCELEELSGILSRFAEDKDLSNYFQSESKRIDMESVKTLLFNLKNNSLIDTKKQTNDFKNFYPCNCCSGKLIEV